MKQIQIMPKTAQQMVYEYQHLPLGGKSVVCPYHINIRKERVGLRVLVGKGDPGEIVKEVKVWAKLKDFDLYKADEKQIRDFMIERSIGIDCSGFVTHVLGYWIKSEHRRRLWELVEYKNNDILSRIRRFFRPIENLGANTLTNLINCDTITNVNDIQPGDLIRSKGKVKNSHHVSLISKVTKVNGKTTEIEYVHSQRYYGDQNGVKFGLIKITDLKKPLHKQEWLEVLDGVNYTLNGYLNQLEDNGVRRLKRVRIHFDTYEEE